MKLNENCYELKRFSFLMALMMNFLNLGSRTLHSYIKLSGYEWNSGNRCLMSKKKTVCKQGFSS